MANAGRLVFALLVLFGGVTLAGTLHRLPPRVATHFDGAGIPNAWSSLTGYAAGLVALGVLLPLAIVGLVGWIGAVRPDLLNVPAREYWLQPANRAEGMRRITAHMWWLAGLVTAMVIGVHLLLIQAHYTMPPRLPTGPLLGLVAVFVVGVGLWLAAFSALLRPPLPPGNRST